MNNCIIDKITLDDLSEERRQLAELIGLDNYKKLLKTFPGSPIYIPKMDNFEKEIRNKRIMNEFTGCNYGELARKYHLSERQIRDIITPQISKNQMRLF